LIQWRGEKSRDFETFELQKRDHLFFVGGGGIEQFFEKSLGAGWSMLILVAVVAALLAPNMVSPMQHHSEPSTLMTMPLMSEVVRVRRLIRRRLVVQLVVQFGAHARGKGQVSRVHKLHGLQIQPRLGHYG
jgi:hypothetical protein